MHEKQNIVASNLHLLRIACNSIIGRAVLPTFAFILHAAADNKKPRLRSRGGAGIESANGNLLRT
jgi:hypothetical protein